MRERERERERDRDRVKREEREKRNLRTAVPASFVTLEFLTPTLPYYKTEAKKLKGNTDEAACLKNCNKI